VRLNFLILSATLVAVFVSLQSPIAFACASCGSGGDDPLILYPNQDWRFYLGVSRSFGFKTVTSNGNLAAENAPRFKDSLTLAVAKALTSQAFVSLTVPYLQNWRDGQYKRAFGDPVLAMRWTVLPQNISAPQLPQFQLMGAYRFAQAKAQQESINEHRLDAFGQGAPETKLGLDVFQGMTDIKFGAAHSFLFPGERNLGGVSVYPGLGQRSVVTLGYGQSGLGKVLLGCSRETRNPKKLNGTEVNDSNLVDNGLFVTGDVEVSQTQVARLTLARKSAFWDNKNGSRNDAVSLAWMWSVAP
jgi:hypothetical protein